MEVTDFDYDLPKELIAQTPIEPRDASRLLVMDKKTGALEHRHFYNLPEYLRPGDVLVFNDTRVMPARLHGTKTTGAHVEVFLLTRKNNTDWEVLVKPGKKLQEGAEIIFSDELSCTILEKTDFGGRIARFRFDGVFEEILDRLGETPLPPYIHEKLKDKERYQTVYNRELGSAAAPTAGLHFTKELMQKIKEMGVEEVFVTLNVGLGTFRPVSEERIEDHEMHSEFYTVSPEAAAAGASLPSARRVSAPWNRREQAAPWCPAATGPRFLSIRALSSISSMPLSPISTFPRVRSSCWFRLFRVGRTSFMPMGKR